MSAPDPTWQQPSRGLLLVRRAQCLLLATLPAVVATVVLAVLAGLAAAVAAALAGAVLTGISLLSVERRWRSWGYAEREDDLLVRRGVLVRRLSVIPYGRMQFVDVTSGPLDRRMGIARVTLHTAAAASDASIPGLPVSEATRLRDRLAALGEARAAGL